MNNKLLIVKLINYFQSKCAIELIKLIVFSNINKFKLSNIKIIKMFHLIFIYLEANLSLLYTYIIYTKLSVYLYII